MSDYEFNRVCKETVQAALKAEYGFCPTRKSDIVLLEADDDRTYIRFKVRDIEYRFDSYHTYLSDGWDAGVWAGRGTITKVS